MCLQEKFRFMKVSPDYENFEIMYSPMNGTTTKTVRHPINRSDQQNNKPRRPISRSIRKKIYAIKSY